MVKNLLTMWETCVWFLGWEDPLEKGMASHSSSLAWRTPRTQELVSHSPGSCKELDTTEQLTFPHTSGDSVVKNPPSMQETQEMWVWSLDWEYSLEEGMATYSSILACRIPWAEEPGRLCMLFKISTINRKV